MNTLAQSPTPAPALESLTSERFPLLLFFDGECSFCNRWVNRVRLADRTHRMRFGAKQGRTFQRVALAHPEVVGVESVVLVERQADGGEKFLVRSAAIREVIKGLPEFRVFDWVLRICPTVLADVGYRIFSKLRGTLFGKWHHCRVPLEEERELYVE